MADGPVRPTAAALAALGVDDWAALLAVALPVVRHLPERHVDAVVRRVASVPPGRLMSGRSRDDLAALLARDHVWDLVEAELPPDAPRPWADPVAEPAPAEEPGLARLEQQLAHLRSRERTLVERVAALRDEVEALTRERDGAVARAETATAATEAALADRDDARAAAEDATTAAAAADERVAREVARVRRRDDGEVAGLREELRTARREADELRRALAAERERPAPATATAGRSTSSPSSGRDDADDRDDSGGRRGRPSRLPEGVAEGTRRAAEWLVAEGRVLLVDGYNITRTQRAELSLEDQRRWLEGAVAALARRRHVDATIFWDSAHGRSTTRRTRGGVTVRFTTAGTSADDELVLHVQMALDPDTPVVAVTDDAELRDRLARHGVDLLDSQSFTWLL